MDSLLNDPDIEYKSGRLIGKVMAYEHLIRLEEFQAASQLAVFIEETEKVVVSHDFNTVTMRTIDSDQEYAITEKARA